MNNDTVRRALAPSVLDVMRRLASQGYETFVVGGFLRDLLLARPTSDVDLATAATPEEVERVLAGETVIPTGIKHGTVTVLLADQSLEITTFRKDGAYTDHRHPATVTYSKTIEEDLSRRDFTVNALAWNETRGLLDPFDGQGDLARRVIRAVGDPSRRFKEDALRMLRALRLSSELRFAIDPACADALFENAPLLRFVARERIREEWVRLIQGDGAAAVMSRYAAVLDDVIPGVDELRKAGLYDRALVRMTEVPKDPVLRLSALFYDFGDDGTRLVSLLSALRLDNATVRRVVLLAGSKTLEISFSRRSVLTAMRLLGPDAFFDALTLRRAEAMARALPASSNGGPVVAPKPAAADGEQKNASGRYPADRTAKAVPGKEERESGKNGTRDDVRDIDRLEAYAKELLSQGAYLTPQDLAVDGSDMAAAGYEGKTIGLKLEKALEYAMLDGVPNTKEDLMRALKKDDLRGNDRP